MIEESASAQTNRRAHEDGVTEKLRDVQHAAAAQSIRAILQREGVGHDCGGTITFATDAMGQSGDVRDVVFALAGGREIGISCKNNHSDLKHSRLSDRLDFVKAWGIHEHGCSDDYWQSIQPIFEKLRNIRKTGQSPQLWSDYTDKANEVYWPILDAFARELHRLCNDSAKDSAAHCARLASYLIGSRDFYKIMARSNAVDVQCFNLRGTLAGKKSPLLPEKIKSIDNKNGGQYSKTVSLNRSYTFNFRIHNASLKIEPSLKFAISMIGTPANLYFQTYEFA